MPAEPCHVSVVIPLYNSAATIQRAVASALRQSLREIEVLIVDDGSQDASLPLARRLAAGDPRIRVIALPENRGKPHAMNTAISEARGAWTAVLDADDWYAPERLASLVALGEKHQVPLIADNQLFYDAAANCFVRTAFPTSTGDQPLTRPAFIARTDPYADFDFGMLKPVLRTDFIRRTGLSYRENARLSEDFLYLVEFFAAGGTGFLASRALYTWTQPFGSLSRKWTTTGAGAWRYDFRSALDANAEVLDALRRRRHHDLANLLQTRARAYRGLQALNDISRKRAEGASLMRLLITASRYPSVWPRLAHRAVHTMRRRYEIPGPACNASPPAPRVDGAGT